MLVSRPQEADMDGSEPGDHWRNVYETKGATGVSWFQHSPEPSLRMIRKTGLRVGSRAIDVGGGASSLVDRLLDDGFHMTVLDIADNALDIARSRLGARAKDVNWIAADITQWRPIGTFDLWHDRAVFHFLTEPEQRLGYMAALKASLAPSGWVVMATFAPTGPERCSGLPVHRWSPTELAAELGNAFQLVESAEEAHETPSGSRQLFTWTLFHRVR
jgi:2-polyprenyl-3-methyl-5-hydroxy-6-metoxy-1,4-benzoquinol methylase